MATGKRQHHGYRRVKCPNCGSIFRSPTIHKWLAYPEKALRDTEITVHINGAPVTRVEQVETVVFPGLREVKFYLCRTCSKRPNTELSQHRST
jgi:adenine-specific DNA methylase